MRDYAFAFGMVLAYVAVAIVVAAFTGLSYRDLIAGMVLFQVCLLTARQMP